MRKVIIVLSILEESQQMKDNEILEEIAGAFSNEEVVLPWCGKVEDISFT